jgi:hypothetical protein
VEEKKVSRTGEKRSREKIPTNKEISMSTMTVSPNGRVRKSLANEIDRLNQILDGLADGLNEAVADAVQNAVAQAIQTALSEVLTSPAVIEQLRQKIGSPVTTPVQPKISVVKSGCRRLLSWIGAKVKAAAGFCMACMKAIGNAGITLQGKVRQVVVIGRQQVMRGLEMVPVVVMLGFRLARKFKMPLLVAIVIGVGIGVVAFVAGRSVAAVGSGIGAFVTTLSVQAGLWLRRMLGLRTCEGQI